MTVADRVRSQSDPDFYSTGGWGYADREADRRFVREHLIREFGLEIGGSLLDAGCGDGWWTSLLAGEGFKATGWDVSADAIDVARREHPGPRYMLGDVAALADAWQFDVVFSRGMVAPTSGRADELVRALVALVKPEGTLLILRTTDGSGRFGPSVIPGLQAENPTVSSLVAMVEPHAQVFKVTVVDDSVQIGARPR